MRPNKADPAANFFNWCSHICDFADFILVTYDDTDTEVRLMQSKVELATPENFPATGKGVDPFTYSVIVSVKSVPIIPYVSERYVPLDPFVKVPTGFDIDILDRPFIWMNENRLHLTSSHLLLASRRELPLNSRNENTGPRFLVPTGMKMSETIIAKITHGSRLFGTTTETSDVDLKTVFTPSARNILLGRISTSNRDGTSNVMGKNTSSDTDQDNHDLIKFMRLLETGTPEGFELLFAPDNVHLIAPSLTWRSLQARSAEFVHADLVPFERLIRKNSTLVQNGAAEEDAAMKMVSTLNKLTSGISSKRPVTPYIDEIVAEVGNTKIVRRDIREGRDGTLHPVLVVAHKAVPINESINFASKLATSIANEAAANQMRKSLSRDQWKQLSLAVRISCEMIELLQTGHLTFPRPEREFLYEVKVGNITLEATRERLDLLGERIIEAKLRTALPVLPNKDAFEEFVVEAHFEAVQDQVKGFQRSI